LYGEKLHSYGVKVKSWEAPAPLAPLSIAYGAKHLSDMYIRKFITTKIFEFYFDNYLELFVVDFYIVYYYSLLIVTGHCHHNSKTLILK